MTDNSQQPQQQMDDSNMNGANGAGFSATPPPAPASSTADVATEPPKQGKGWLKRAFSAAGHMAIGAATAMAVKTALCAAAITVGAPATVAAIAAAAGTGMVTSSISLWRERNKQREEGAIVESFWSKKTAKRLDFGAITGAAGGALFSYFGDDITNGLCKMMGGSEAATAAGVPPGSAGLSVVVAVVVMVDESR